MKKSLISIFIVFSFATSLNAETAWKNISAGINSREFNSVIVDIKHPDIIYIGTPNGLYKSHDGGANWQRIFSGWGPRKNIRQIYIKNDRVFLCTDKGLFMSKDEGKSWTSYSGLPSRASVLSTALLGNTIFITTTGGLFKSEEGKNRWEGLFSDTEDIREDETDDLEFESPRVRAVATSFTNPSYIYIGTDDGVFISKDEGATFSRFSDEGLLDKRILFLAEFPAGNHKLYAVTKSAIFYFDNGWHGLETDSNLIDFRSIAFDLEQGNSTWIAAKRGVYKTIDVSTDEERAEHETQTLLYYFKDEPAINEVQERAIVYGEVHPNKIADWRRRASVSAILPRLSFGIDESKSDTYEIYTSASTQYIVEGPVRSSDGWDITLTWDLGDLIWNTDQTLIDVRSKLMVQLRDDILDEVNSYYFERRRLQIELMEAPPKEKKDRVKKELRIQELTANLDALTGGWFSREQKNRKR